MIFRKSGNRNVSTPSDGNETHGFGSSVSFAPDRCRWEPYFGLSTSEFLCVSSVFKSHPWVTRGAFEIS
jgi:hypothetical protein